MTTRSKLWLTFAFIYGAFFYWYTDFSGPITEKEIQAWKATMQTNGSTPKRIAYFETFFRTDSGRQFLMLNAIDLNENPPAVAGAESGERADKLMGRYLEHMLAEFLKRACHPVVSGNAVFTAFDLAGIEGAENWDQGALVRYRSRRDIMHIIANPATLEKHRFKVAALEKTIAYPIEPGLYVGDLRLMLGLLLLTIAALLDNRILARR